MARPMLDLDALTSLAREGRLTHLVGVLGGFYAQLRGDGGPRGAAALAEADARLGEALQARFGAQTVRLAIGAFGVIASDLDEAGSAALEAALGEALIGHPAPGLVCVVRAPTPSSVWGAPAQGRAVSVAATQAPPWAEAMIHALTEATAALRAARPGEPAGFREPIEASYSQSLEPDVGDDALAAMAALSARIGAFSADIPVEDPDEAARA